MREWLGGLLSAGQYQPIMLLFLFLSILFLFQTISPFWLSYRFSKSFICLLSLTSGHTVFVSQIKDRKEEFLSKNHWDT